MGQKESLVTSVSLGLYASNANAQNAFLYICFQIIIEMNSQDTIKIMNNPLHMRYFIQK